MKKTNDDKMSELAKFFDAIDKRSDVYTRPEIYFSKKRSLFLDFLEELCKPSEKKRVADLESLIQNVEKFKKDFYL